MPKETIINKLDKEQAEHPVYKVCPTCNEKFIAKGNQKYCCEACSMGKNYRNRVEKELSNKKYYVGREVIISEHTDNEELNEFTSQYGNRVVITDIGGDYFWGVVMKDKVICHYHMEYKDIVEFTGVEYPNITNNLSEFTGVEQCRYCGEFFADEDIKEGKCSRCARAVEEHV